MIPAPTGHLRVRAARAGPRTVLSEVARTAPFHLGRASHRGNDGAAEAIVQQVGPGLFPGETLRVEVAVDPGAALTLRGQAATKVYPCPDPDGTPARLETRLRVAAGATLAYLPGALIPFRDAALVQETVVDLAPGARFALAEILTPGRVAMGERDAYRRLDLRLRIRLGGRLLLVERADLEPARRPTAAPGRHGGFAAAGTLYLVGFPVPAAWATPQTVGPVRWAAGATGPLTVLRLLGDSAQAVAAAIAARLRETAAEQGTAPSGPYHAPT